MKPDTAAISALLEGSHADPFSLLGVHEGPAGLFARAVLPGAEVAVAFSLDGKELGALVRVDERGLFEGTISGPRQPVHYRAGALGAEWWVSDPYSFGPVLGPLDDYLINEGTHHRLYDKLGAHLIEHEGTAGTHFAVWAPNAAQVSVVGDFNQWGRNRGALREFGEGWTVLPIGASFPSRRPLAPLDRIVTSPGWHCHDAQVHHSALASIASDHLPVRARLSLTA